jgi:hypothetical protein
MIHPSPESKRLVKSMLAKVVDMSTISMPPRATPAKTIRPGKEHTRLVADIKMYLGIQHRTNLSNNKVPSMQCSTNVEASQEICMMTTILP